MNGTISVSSEVGKGSEFAFEVPADAAMDGPQMRGPVLSGRSAVILSMNAVEAEAIAMTIRAHGGDVHIATTAAQAAAMAESCGTLLVDAAMEQADGRLLKRLRQAGFATAEAITMIAPTDRGMLGEFRASGYATFLARPVRGETLLRVLLAGLAAEQAAGPGQGTDRRQDAAGTRAGCPGFPSCVAEDNDINAMLARSDAAQGRASRRHRRQRQGCRRSRDRRCTQASATTSCSWTCICRSWTGWTPSPPSAATRKRAGVAPVPIMVLSADSQEKTRHAVLAHGASGFVTKPLDPEALVRTVEEQAAA